MQPLESNFLCKFFDRVSQNRPLFASATAAACFDLLGRRPKSFRLELL